MPAPQKLGKYEVRRQLGRGAMGIVYEGFDPFIQRTVALKTVRKELLDQDQAQEMLARFQREAQAAGRLNHPNIVAIYDYGEDQETAYIAMEFIKGKELKELFAENTRFTLPNIVDIMTQLLTALNYSHLNGVVHRDIKPANIIVMADGQVKIADFGIARLDSSNLTQTGLVLGTPNYMSPEQFMGQHVDGRSDLFSAGVVLYQLLTGEKPFVGESTTTIMYQVLNNTPNAPPSSTCKSPRRSMGWCARRWPNVPRTASIPARSSSTPLPRLRPASPILPTWKPRSPLSNPPKPACWTAKQTYSPRFRQPPGRSSG